MITIIQCLAIIVSLFWHIKVFFSVDSEITVLVHCYEPSSELSHQFSA